MGDERPETGDWKQGAVDKRPRTEITEFIFVSFF